MNVRYRFQVNSDTINTNSFNLFNHRGELVYSEGVELPYQYQQRGVTRRSATVAVDALRAFMETGGYQAIRDVVLNAIGGDDFVRNSLLQVELPQFDDESFGDMLTTRGRVRDPVTGGFPKPETVLKRYNLYETNPKPIPYDNYDLNESELPCVYNYLSTQFPRLSKKKIERFNHYNGVKPQELIDFATEYKIQCKLFNAAGEEIYDNKLPNNKEYKNIIGMIANRHFYPLKGKCQAKPKFVTGELEKGVDENKCITFADNAKVYSHAGTYKNLKGDVIYNEFFKGMPNNFHYKPDCIKFNALMYSSDNVSQAFVEYDLDSAYFNAVEHSETQQVPIFSPSDFWKKYKYYQGWVPDAITYYSFSQEALERLREYGITKNVCSGEMLTLLLNEGLLSELDILYEKKPSKYALFETFRERVHKCVEKYKDVLVDNPDAKEFSKTFVYYNGILGKTLTQKEYTISGLHEEDFEVLNFGKDDIEWIPQGDGVYKKTMEEMYRPINLVPYYNVIVEQTSIELLQKILKVKKELGLMPLKIKVDALAYKFSETKLKKLDEIFESSKPFEYKRRTEFLTTYIDYSQQYINIEEVVYEVGVELKGIRQNVTYTGPPGTGKTYSVKGKLDYATASAVSNFACITIDGITLYKLFLMWDPSLWWSALYRHSGKTIWVDEYSMVSHNYWCFLATGALYYDMRFIFTGDEDQLGPINEEIDYSSPFFEKFFGERVKLTENHRNAENLVAEREFILKNPNWMVANRYCSMKRSIENWWDLDHHITYTNNTIYNLHKIILRKRDLQYSYKVDKNGNYIWDVDNGVILMSRITVKRKSDVTDPNSYYCAKQERFKVVGKKIAPDGSKQFYLKSLAREREVMIVSEEYLCNFVLGFAFTCHKAQGATIRDKFAIHDVEKMCRFDKRIIYTAVTRGVDFDDISIRNDIYPQISAPLTLPLKVGTEEYIEEEPTEAFDKTKQKTAVKKTVIKYKSKHVDTSKQTTLVAFKKGSSETL